MTARPDQCHGVNAKGKRCGLFRLSSFAKPSHLKTPEAWFCANHKDQAKDGAS